MTPTRAPAEPPAPAVPGDLRSEKIQPGHLDRLAVVYVRQSTPQQVLDHQESTRLQYGLVARAAALGWPRQRILVIDDDQGRSGASAEGRTGFQRLVAEVSLANVGLILGLQMSRLARSNADWHRLLEVCALFRTLLADLDGVYDPGDYNDRLLLGLKGTVSEAELHLLKQRLYQGRLSKARRGELRFALPVGYVWRAPGEIGFDPDEQVQAVVRLVFRAFADLGTLGGVLRYLVRHDVRLGVRVREGPGKGSLVWRRPNRVTVQMMLKHPIYAGAYVYGRRQADPPRQRPGRPSTGRVVMAPAAWLASLPGHVPAYISREAYEANQARLQANRARAESMGVARDGAALLAGLVVCARCGVRLGVRYDDRRRFTYECVSRANHYGQARCQHLPGGELDRYVSAHVLAALAPAALDLSLAAAERLQEERDTLTQLWQQRLERARYEADRAARHYHAVEPEHRLVARQLEREWEADLAALQSLEAEARRALQRQPRVLTAAERAAIGQLATDIPALWAAPTTTAAERKEIIRQVVERVVVDVQGASERVRLRIDWAGGGSSTGEVTRSIAAWSNLSAYPQLCARVAALTAGGCPAAAIAERLRAEGFTTVRPGRVIGAQAVRALQHRLGLARRGPRRVRRDGLGEQEWWPTELARRLAISRSSLYNWIQRGWVRARQLADGGHRWVIWADAAEVERLRRLRQRSTAEEARRRWRDEPGASAEAQPTGDARAPLN
jgi:DNA invertase Pin-like site-specific DNA recombinase